MTHNLPLPEPDTTAPSRVRHFLRNWGGEGVVSRALTPTEGIDLTTADLRILLAQADAFERQNPTAAKVIEAELLREAAKGG